MLTALLVLKLRIEKRERGKRESTFNIEDTGTINNASTRHHNKGISSNTNQDPKKASASMLPRRGPQETPFRAENKTKSQCVGNFQREVIRSYHVLFF